MHCCTLTSALVLLRLGLEDVALHLVGRDWLGHAVGFRLVVLHGLGKAGHDRHGAGGTARLLAAGAPQDGAAAAAVQRLEPLGQVFCVWQPRQCPQSAAVQEQ